MKDCYKCGETKDEAEFSMNKNKKDGLNSECKECQKAYFREYYKKNKKKHIKAVTKTIHYKRQQLAFIKLETGCSKCGYKEHPSALHFHHRDPSQKKFDISRCGYYGMEDLLNEINKCDVICANCHSIEHSNWDFTSEIKMKTVKKRKLMNERVLKKYFCDCGNTIHYRSTRCLPCSRKNKKSGNLPNDKTLKEEIWKTPCEHVANKYGISGSYLSRYCRDKGIDKPPRGYWTKKKRPD